VAVEQQADVQGANGALLDYYKIYLDCFILTLKFCSCMTLPYCIIEPVATTPFCKV